MVNEKDIVYFLKELGVNNSTLYSNPLTGTAKAVLDEIIKKFFSDVSEYEKLIKSHTEMSRSKYIITAIFDRPHIKYMDEKLGLPNRFVTEFEYSIAEAAHRGDPNKITEDDLKRLIIVDE